MSQQRECDVCGAEYLAKRSTSRFCSARCRNRNARHPVEAAAAASTEGEDAPAPDEGSLAEASLKELTEVGRQTSALGLSVLILARRLDKRVETGSQLAALMKEFRTVRAEALRTASTADDIDELRSERGSNVVDIGSRRR